MQSLKITDGTEMHQDFMDAPILMTLNKSKMEGSKASKHESPLSQAIIKDE
jgi:hypothetical protein